MTYIVGNHQKKNTYGEVTSAIYSSFHLWNFTFFVSAFLNFISHSLFYFLILNDLHHTQDPTYERRLGKIYRQLFSSLNIIRRYDVIIVICVLVYMAGLWTSCSSVLFFLFPL